MVKRMKLKCQRCNHEWIYQGKNPYYASCPFCKTSVSIKSHQVIEDELETVNTEEIIKKTEPSTEDDLNEK